VEHVFQGNSSAQTRAAERAAEEASAPAQGTQSIDRAAQLLVRVLESDRPMALGELAAATELPKSTASRLLTALERHGLVHQDDDRGPLRPGPAILRFATRDLFERHLVEEARQSLDRLGEASGETVNLAVPASGAVEHIAQADSRHFLGTGQWIGRRVDFHSTAVGKVFLAYGVATLPDGELERSAPSTIVDRSALARQLRQVRKAGFATAVDELEPGLAALAAPVKGPGGDVVAAISITGPTLRLGPERVEELRPVLIQEARALAERVGHPDPDEEAA
jgi:IclR family acetate operon transcriptional repressor